MSSSLIVLGIVLAFLLMIICLISVFHPKTRMKKKNLKQKVKKLTKLNHMLGIFRKSVPKRKRNGLYPK